MIRKKIEWITFNAFIDTDLYIVKELSNYYDIEWYIIITENDKYEYNDAIEELKKRENITIELLTCGKRLRKLNCILFYNHLLNEINKRRADLIVSSLSGAPYFVPIFYKKCKNKKTIMAIHNVHVPKGGKAYTFFKIYNKYTIKHFKNFVTYSKSQYRDLYEIDKEKNILYAPFILKDYGESNNIRRESLITFLNFGNIREYKRIDVLIKAAQIVYERTNKKFKVIIAGKCDNWEKYQDMIKYEFLFDLRISHVENKDIPNLFNETDYFVAPYQDIAQSGSSIIAINYSKPIIASRLPAFEEYIINEKTGYLIEPASIDSLVDVMEKIIKSNNQDYSQMVKELEKNRDDYFSTIAIVDKYRRFFDDVISK